MRDLKDAVGDLPQRTARIIELIQVAAVAVANIEIEMYGESRAGHYVLTTPGAEPAAQVDLVLELVRDERIRQDELWGVQSGDPFERLMILLEEVGELAAEIEAPEGFAMTILPWVEDLEHRARDYLEGL